MSEKMNEANKVKKVNKIDEILAAGEVKSYLKMRSQEDQIRYEFTNFSTIVLRKSGMYHKAVGNSAIILKMLGAKTKIRSHYNAVVKQEVLELSVHVGRIEETKLFFGAFGKKILRDDGEFFVVKLNKPIEAKRMRRERSSAVLKTEVTEDILTRRRKETPLAKDVRELFKEAALLIRTMKGTDGAVIGRALLDKLVELQQVVREVTREMDEVVRKKIAARAGDVADDVLGMLLLVPNFVMQSDRISGMGRCVDRIALEMGAIVKKKEDK